MSRYSWVHLCVANLLLLGLAGCGGGNYCAAGAVFGGISGCAAAGTESPTSLSSSAPAAIETIFQGVFQGTASNGKTEQAIVLEDGSFWNIWGVPSGAALAVQGISTGSATASNGTFSISFKDFPAPGTSPVNGQGSGTYSQSNFVGTTTENGATSSFNLIAPVQVTYDYNVAANLTSLSGSWSGSLLNGETATINILASGALAGTSSLGCTFTGTAIPRPSGKNVFNFSLTFGGSPCVAANQTASGIGLTYPLSDGKNQLIAGLVNPSQTFASVFFAQR